MTHIDAPVPRGGRSSQWRRPRAGGPGRTSAAVRRPAQARTPSTPRTPATISEVDPGRASAFPSIPPTSEVDWVRMVARAPELPLSSRPVVVVAPHPDDESLAIGGLLAELRAHEVAIEVLAVTNGEASHPTLGNLDAVRAVEQRRALLALGVPAAPVRLGLPDGDVAGHRAALTVALEQRCAPETVILAPWEHDGHPDHDVCGEVALDVARRTGAAVWAYPVWAWRWADLADLEPLALRRVTLRPEAQRAKASAVSCHQTQTSHLEGDPILSEDVLTHFRRPWDVIIDARERLEG